MKNNDKTELQNQIIKTGISLVERGLVARTWGNVSGKTQGSEKDSFFITPSGRGYEDLKTSDIVQVSMEDLSWEGDVKPSSEKLVHQAIYTARPSIKFIIHTHQTCASALGCCGKAFIKSDIDNGAEIPIAKYGPSGSELLRDNVQTAVENSSSNIVIMKNHGVICFGESHDEAYELAINLEKYCEELLISNGINPTEKSYTTNEKQFMCNDPCVIEFSKEKIPAIPYLDDFAMIVGMIGPVAKDKDEAVVLSKKYPAVVVPGEGILCSSDNSDDAKAIAMIARKNILAYEVAKLYNTQDGIVPKSHGEELRELYLNTYSKLAKE